MSHNVFTSLSAGLQHVDPHLVEAGRAFGYKGYRLFKTVQLPAVVPSIFSGLRLALAQAWLFLVAAELIASSMGLGFWARSPIRCWGWPRNGPSPAGLRCRYLHTTGDLLWVQCAC